MKKLAALGVGFLATALLLEFTVRLFLQVQRPGPDLETSSSFKIESDATSLRTFRIVTLGESTTAARYIDDQDVSWPKQMSDFVNRSLREDQKPYSVRVFNLASPAINTAILLERLEERLNVRAFGERPDAVVAMMGINDSLAMVVNRSRLYRSSALARFVYWGYVSWRCPNCYRISEYEKSQSIFDTKNAATVALIQRLQNKREEVIRNNSALIELEVLLREELAKSPESALNLTLGWVNWTYQLMLHPSFAVSETEFRTVGRLGPWRLRALQYANIMTYAADMLRSNERGFLLNREAVHLACMIYNQVYPNGREECIRLLIAATREGVELSGNLMRMAHAMKIQDVPEIREVLRWNGIELLPSSKDMRSVATIAAYRNLLRLSRKFGFQIYAMHYPTAPIDELESALKSAGARPGEVRFISNENFNRVVNPENVSQYFEDLFGRRYGYNFGHTTKKGHALIAENVSRELIKHIGE